MTEWIQTGLVAAILAVLVVRWIREDWAMWQGWWFRIRRRLRR